MHPLHILDHSPPLHSGYVFRSLGLLHAQQKMGWHPICLTTPRHEISASENTQCIHQNLMFYRTKTPKITLPVLKESLEIRATYLRLQELYAQIHHIDLLHAHSPVLCALPALRFAKKTSLPVVYEIRAFWEDAAVDLGHTKENSLRYRFTRMMETHAVQQADHIVCICEGLRKDLLERGIPAEKISLICNACDLERHQPIDERDRTLEANLNLEQKIVIGFVGSFYAYEGLDLLIDAFAPMKQALPNLQLLFIGGGPMEAQLKEKAAPYGTDIRFLGRIPNAEIHRYYSLFDLLVYPRKSKRITELVTPLKPLEAMAMTRNLIASAVGGHQELIQHDKTGLLFAPDNSDALAETALRLLNEPDLAVTLRKNGYNYVTQAHSWQHIAQDYAEIYQKAEFHAKKWHSL